MTYTAFAIVAAVVGLVVICELLAAVIPVIVVIAFVPPEERHTLADLLAATDSSRRLRLWPALRAAVAARRVSRRRGGPARQP
ncbi:hypothetical protein [Paractinoplanes brasiliensis]|uniref:Uncharacterized protein n=1 Tax=Paractinoplanes brasiliensis TaxID=52695 RepID=A0A4R6K1M1_9ACTN|nr:hypothetical protein [Actinoplanes brasiliensis]TDO41506.1 hypothetical protein C8E87_5239 [Actinoplanes brasiliensis]GID27209.1 hypothetical protein Abr02nite_21920 [Actinoplanes brasiliensis]